jgi:hypothetical protein
VARARELGLLAPSTRRRLGDPELVAVTVAGVLGYGKIRGGQC